MTGKRRASIASECPTRCATPSKRHQHQRDHHRSKVDAIAGILDAVACKQLDVSDLRHLEVSIVEVRLSNNKNWVYVMEVACGSRKWQLVKRYSEIRAFWMRLCSFLNKSKPHSKEYNSKDHPQDHHHHEASHDQEQHLRHDPAVTDHRCSERFHFLAGLETDAFPKKKLFHFRTVLETRAHQLEIVLQRLVKRLGLCQAKELQKCLWKHHCGLLKTVMSFFEMGEFPSSHNQTETDQEGNAAMSRAVSSSMKSRSDSHSHSNSKSASTHSEPVEVEEEEGVVDTNLTQTEALLLQSDGMVRLRDRRATLSGTEARPSFWRPMSMHNVFARHSHGDGENISRPSFLSHGNSEPDLLGQRRTKRASSAKMIALKKTGTIKSKQLDVLLKNCQQQQQLSQHRVTLATFHDLVMT